MTFKILTTEWKKAPRTTSSHIFAIGDIHGCATHLKQMKSVIIANASEKSKVIYLGDLCDRGSDTQGVFDLVEEGFPANIEQIELWSNHDNMMHNYITKGRDNDWMDNGSGQTIQSYGHYDYTEFREQFPKNHLAIFDRMKIYHIEDEYLFVHGGMPPLKDIEYLDNNVEYFLSNQRAASVESDNPLWVRYDFLWHLGTFDRNMCVVHGHTIQKAYVSKDRIGIDTGAYSNGILTCVELKDNMTRFHHVISPYQNKYVVSNELRYLDPEGLKLQAEIVSYDMD